MWSGERMGACSCLSRERMGACSCLSQEGAGSPGAGGSGSTAREGRKLHRKCQSERCTGCRIGAKALFGQPRLALQGSLESPRLDGSRVIPGAWLSAGSHRGGMAAAQLPTREPGLAASQQGELERDAQGWKGTGRGWLISITPSSQARLGGRAWDSPSCPGAGAEKLPPAPGTGLLRSPSAQLPRSSCRSQMNGARAWGSPGRWP